MKSLRMLVLLVSLSVCTFAGNMDNGSPVPPPPPPPPPTMSTEQVINEPDITTVPDDDPELLTEVMTSLLQSVLALF